MTINEKIQNLYIHILSRIPPGEAQFIRDKITSIRIGKTPNIALLMHGEIILRPDLWYLFSEKAINGILAHELAHVFEPDENKADKLIEKWVFGGELEQFNLELEEHTQSGFLKFTKCNLCKQRMGTEVLIVTMSEKEIYINLCKQYRSGVEKEGYARLMEKFGLGKEGDIVKGF